MRVYNSGYDGDAGRSGRKAGGTACAATGSYRSMATAGAPDEDLWDARFAQGQDTLSLLADEARRDRDSGLAIELDPDKV